MTQTPVLIYQKEGSVLTMWVNDPLRNIIKAPGFIKLSGITSGWILNDIPLPIRSNSNEDGLQKVTVTLPSMGIPVLKTLRLENASISRVGGSVNLPPAPPTETGPGETYEEPNYGESDDSQTTILGMSKMTLGILVIVLLGIGYFIFKK